MRGKIIAVSMMVVFLMLLAQSAMAQYAPVPGVMASEGIKGPEITPGTVVQVDAPEAAAPAMTGPGKIHFGRLNVITNFGIQEIFDDNIFLGNTIDPNKGIVSDFITHFVPGIRLSYELPQRGHIDLGYQGDFALYADKNENDWSTQRFDFITDYKAPGGLIVRINNALLDAEDPYGAPNQFGLGVPKTKRLTNDLQDKVGFAFSDKFRLFVLNNFYYQSYKNPSDFAQDYQDLEIGIGPEMTVLPKTWAFLRYFYGARDYYSTGLNPLGTLVDGSNDSDSLWHRINTGLTWDGSQKFSGEISFGYQWRAYSNEVDAFGRPYKDQDMFIIGTSVNYFMDPNTTITVNLLRALREAGADTRENYIDTGFGAGLRHTFFTKYTFVTGAGYALNEYEESVNQGRKDNNYTLNAGLEYRIREWLTTSFGYIYTQKDSNYSQFDFSDNRVIAGVNAMY